MKKYLVNTPLLDLRREPVDCRSSDGKDPLQETQLLYNEQLIGKESNHGWMFVEAVGQQKCYANGSWGGYRGWVRSEHLVEVQSFDFPNLFVKVAWASLHVGLEPEDLVKCEVSLGTSLIGCEEIDGLWVVETPDGVGGVIRSEEVQELSRVCEESLGEKVISIGKNFLQTPYFWGGRSAYRKDWAHSFTGVDCSSLVHLLYRIFGKQLPRDAHDQFLMCYRREREQLQVGDLLFLSEVKNSARISHVMLYAGGNQWLEAEMRAKKVRMISTEEKFRIPLEELTWGCRNEEHWIFFGSVFQKEQLLSHATLISVKEL